MIIKYSGTGIVTAASGEVWDLDGNGASQSEKFVLTLIDKNGNATALPTPEQTTEDPYDGQPWEFAFSGIADGIDRIEIDFEGTKTTNIGLVFKNFDATGATVGSKPAPALSTAKMIVLLGILLVTGLFASRSLRRA